MRRLAVLLLSGGLLASCPPARAQTDASWASEWGFPVGEGMEYAIYWGFIHVGTAVMTNFWVEEDGRRLLTIRLRTKSNKVLSMLYPVDDHIESVIDPETFLPIRFHKQLSEGSYRADQLTLFDHAAGTALWKNNLKPDEPTKTFEIKPDTRDIVCQTYYLRRVTFEAGKKYPYTVMADEKLYDLIVNAEHSETIDLDAYGKVPSLKIEPEAKFGGVFVRKGRMWMWVSETARKVCTKLAAEVPVANVRLLLRKVYGPGADDWHRPAVTKNQDEAPSP